VLLLGEMLAEMGMREGREVSWLPSYGPEMRSGSAHCHICIHAESVGSPLIEHPDALVAMNEVSLRKFAPQCMASSAILYNGEALPEGFHYSVARIYCIPGSKIANQLGNAKVSNMVMLGALLELTKILPKETAGLLLEEKITNIALRELDNLAIRAGMERMREALSSPCRVNNL
jgi:2-oxoisovalerate ferredoxin oxidoreductase beta subunit